MDMPLLQTQAPVPPASKLASFGIDFARTPGNTSITGKLILVYEVNIAAMIFVEIQTDSNQLILCERERQIVNYRVQMMDIGLNIITISVNEEGSNFMPIEATSEEDTHAK